MADSLNKQRLVDDLISAGFPKVTLSSLNPLDIFISGGLSVQPYINVVLKHAKNMDMNDKCWVARMVTEKGLNEAVPFLLSVFHEWNGESCDLWAVGNALYVIDHKHSYLAIVEICKDRRYGAARQMLMGSLARMKTPDSYQVLIDCLNDTTVRGHAIEALGRFGETAAIPILESLSVKKGLYEFKALNVALQKLRSKTTNRTP